MSPTSSFQILMDQLHAGDDEAATRLFQRFAEQLIALARAQLADEIKRKVDPEDVLQSVFRSFFLRHRRGEFQLENWDSLWGVLTVMALRKCGRLNDYFHALRRDVRREMHEADLLLKQACDREPTPAEAAVLRDLLEQALSDLEARDRRIVALYLQGHHHAEIAAQLFCGERTVRRTLVRFRKRLHRLEESILESEQGSVNR